MDRPDAMKPHQKDALRRELTQALDPGADTHFAREVLDRTDPAQSAPKASWERALAWTGGALAMGLCAALALRMAPSERQDLPAGMVARGGTAKATALLGLEVYRHPQGEPPRRIALRDGDLLPSGDGLTFTLLNRGADPSVARILVMDAQQTISWLEPAEDSAANTVDVAPRRTLDLPEGVTLTNLPAGPTRIIAVFGAADQPRAALEKALQSGDLAALQQVPGVTTAQAVTLQTP